MSLSLRVTRCAGRPYGLGADDPVCERRNQCARYLAMISKDRERWPDGYPPDVPVHTGLCLDGQDWYIAESEPRPGAEGER